MNRHRLIDDSDITRVSLRTWKLTRPLFGEFVETYCGFSGGIRRYELHGQDVLDGAERRLSSPSAPRLILIDEFGSELWLGGCLAGYTGEGVSGSGYILQTEGFDEKQVDLLPLAERLHLRKGESEPLWFEKRSDAAAPRGLTWSDHIYQLRATGYFKEFDEVTGHSS